MEMTEDEYSCVMNGKNEVGDIRQNYRILNTGVNDTATAYRKLPVSVASDFEKMRNSTACTLRCIKPNATR
jgi:hypothetical protein